MSLTATKRERRKDMALASLLLAANRAPLGAIFAELVPTRQRATIIGIAYATSAASFGGTASYLNTWLAGIGVPWVFVGYMVLLCLTTMVVVLFMPATRGRELRWAPPPRRISARTAISSRNGATVCALDGGCVRIGTVSLAGDGRDIGTASPRSRRSTSTISWRLQVTAPIRIARWRSARYRSRRWEL
jgi:energy-converting hydrogenase Eha subunit E